MKETPAQVSSPLVASLSSAHSALVGAARATVFLFFTTRSALSVIRAGFTALYHHRHLFTAIECMFSFLVSIPLPPACC